MSEYTDFIKISKYSLISGGLWPFKITDNPLNTKIYQLYTKFQTVAYVCFAISLIINLIILVIKHDQPTRIFSSINVLIIVGETCVKIILFQVKKIPHMCADIINNERAIFNSKDDDVKRCYKKEISYCQTLNTTQFIVTMLSCSSFTLVFLLQVFTADDMAIFKDQPFMHDMWYPFKRESNMPWVIMLNIYTVLQSVSFNTATQTTFSALMIYASARLKILQIRLRKFDEIAWGQNGGDIFGTVKELIKEHQLLIKFVNTLNERTKYVMLLEFVLNSVSLATGTIQLVVVDVTRLLSVITIVVLVLVQIFILAWNANEIIMEGLKVADAITASKWQEQSLSVQKLFLLMILRAQKPLGLTAGPFFQMTTRSALMTVKVAYSYMSLMAQNYEV